MNELNVERRREDQDQDQDQEDEGIAYRFPHWTDHRPWQRDHAAEAMGY